MNKRNSYNNNLIKKENGPIYTNTGMNIPYDRGDLSLKMLEKT